MTAYEELVEIVTRDPESSGGDRTWATDLVDAHGSEVANELARLFDERSRSRLDGGIMTAADAADLIRQHAAGKDTGGALQAPAGESTQPSFFQPGHGYTRRDGTTFQCITVTTTPWNGERLAIGWHTDAMDITSIAWRGLGEWLHEYDGVEPPTGGDAG